MFTAKIFLKIFIFLILAIIMNVCLWGNNFYWLLQFWKVLCKILGRNVSFRQHWTINATIPTWEASCAHSNNNGKMIVDITSHFLIGHEVSNPQKVSNFQYCKPDQKLVTGDIISPSGKSTWVSLTGPIVQSTKYLINLFIPLKVVLLSDLVKEAYFCCE